MVIPSVYRYTWTQSVPGSRSVGDDRRKTRAGDERATSGISNERETGKKRRGHFLPDPLFARPVLRSSSLTENLEEAAFCPVRRKTSV